MNNEYIIFIESNTSGSGEQFVDLAIKEGLVPVFLTSTPEKYPFLTKLFIHPVICDTKDDDNLFKLISQYSNVVGIFSSSEYYIEIAAKLAKAFGLPANTPTAVSHARNKAQLCHILNTADLAVPHTVEICDFQAFDRHSGHFKFPVVAKPTSGSGSSLVKLCNDSTELQTHVEKIFAQQVSHPLSTTKQSVLVQEYVAGEEFSVETFSHNGTTHVIGITQKHLASPPYFIESGHEFPAEIDPQLSAKIEALVINALNAIDYHFGPAHTEIRVRHNTPYLIEINPRLAGGMIPELIKQATGLDLVLQTLRLYTGKPTQLQSQHHLHACIRFIIANQNGYFTDLRKPADSAIRITKPLGSYISLAHDFSDRLGFVITTATQNQAAINQAENEIDNADIVFSHDSVTTDSTLKNTGRLAAALDEELHHLIAQRYPQHDLSEEYRHLSWIDSAHVMMLFNQGFLSNEATRKILAEISDLQKHDFAQLKSFVSARGTYLIYENYLIEKLGIDVAGKIHTGRSRNDINATLFKLTARQLTIEIFESLWLLRATLLRQAQENLSTVFPIYSQYQTALPSNLAFYYLGLDQVLSRDMAELKHHFVDLLTCPMGSGASAGTTLPINPTEVAHALGFQSVAQNALDAIANRDIALRIQNTLSTIAVTISRLATDFHIWTTNEFSFIELPDSLCGSSSMMPQKKNPYLLEKVKGYCASIISNQAKMFNTMQKTPFSNSVEVGTEAIIPFHESIFQCKKSLRVMQKHIDSLTVNTTNTTSSAIKHVTCATYICEHLVKEYHIPFREAHFKIGDKIRASLENKMSGNDSVWELAPTIEEQKHTPLTWSDHLEYGSGPGFKSCRTQLAHANDALRMDSFWMHRMKIDIDRRTIPFNEQLASFKC
ncbi:lyase family protein [Vibrio ruber]|uniref:lyase family protein n=1 Tax=Vibrio ruber TaxID=184755 RepID=UPI002892B73C|nr:lyase family protein [Vibrio ruber]WNJ97402.1 lyase family protein [Vibrio ruber]